MAAEKRLLVCKLDGKPDSLRRKQRAFGRRRVEQERLNPAPGGRSEPATRDWTWDIRMVSQRHSPLTAYCSVHAA